MSNNITEAIFQSIDEITSAKISGLSFDRTELCTIIQTYDNFPNRYWVSNGSIKFEAISLNERTYKKNDQVYVTIPQGDYALQKIIVGKHTANNIISYSSPFEDFEIMEGLKIVNNNNKLSKAVSQGGNISCFKDGLSFQNNGVGSYTLFGIKLAFNTFGLLQKQGNYGVIITLYQGEKVIQSYTIDSENLHGNPYTLVDNIYFNYVLNLPNKFKITKLTKVEATLYVYNNFSDEDKKNKNSIITLSDLEVFFGYSKTALKDIGTSLYSVLDSGSRDTSKIKDNLEQQMTITLDWLYSGKIYNENNPYDTNDFKIYWCYYNKGNGNLEFDDEFEDWVLISGPLNVNDKTSYEYSLALKQGDKKYIKAFIVQDQEEEEDEEASPVYWSSKAIKFKPKEKVAAAARSMPNNSLFLEYPGDPEAVAELRRITEEEEIIPGNFLNNSPIMNTFGPLSRVQINNDFLYFLNGIFIGVNRREKTEES